MNKCSRLKTGFFKRELPLYLLPHQVDHELTHVNRKRMQAQNKLQEKFPLHQPGYTIIAEYNLFLYYYKTRALCTPSTRPVPTIPLYQARHVLGKVSIQFEGNLSFEIVDVFPCNFPLLLEVHPYTESVLSDQLHYRLPQDTLKPVTLYPYHEE